VKFWLWQERGEILVFVWSKRLDLTQQGGGTQRKRNDEMTESQGTKFDKVRDKVRDKVEDKMELDLFVYILRLAEMAGEPTL
jgi:hypothetical protein